MANPTTSNPAVKNWNKPAYIIFVALGLFYAYKKDVTSACIYWNMAVVFDPFDINKPFPKRPLYQRIWLYVHGIIGFTLLILLLTEVF